MSATALPFGSSSQATRRIWRSALAIIVTAVMAVTLLMAAPPPPAAAAVTDETPSFTLNQNDLEFILRQIQISEAHAADVLNPSNYELLCTDQGDSAQDCVADIARPRGVRTVDGSYNNLVSGRVDYGSTQEAFPRLLEAEWRQAEPEALDLGFEPNAEATGPDGEAIDMSMCSVEGGVQNTCYAQTQGNVYDSHPRVISNLIVDQTTNNPAILNQIDNGTAFIQPGLDRVITPNTAPDEELSAPFNTFLGFFGQFFDHGLDLVSKGGNGTLIVPLQPDDPLYNAATPQSNFITLSRATRVDGDSTEHKNLTTPFIDQNQTYSSHPSHQVFLREYKLVDGVPRATGRLLEGPNGGMAKWRDLKEQAHTVLGINLTDADLLDIPLLLTDLYGNFVPGENGFPQLLSGDPSSPTRTEGALGGNGLAVPGDVLGTGHAFLDDIAHGSTPVVGDGGELLPRFNPDGTPVLGDDGEPVLTGYNNALLDEHFMAGDGRVNENVGLTAVHAVFHAEHNRMVGVIEQLLERTHPEQALLEAQDSDERGGMTEFAKAFRGEPHSYVSHKSWENLPGYMAPGTSEADLPAGWGDDDWSYEERLFQAAKFATEMQYQHLVFEEFGRKIAPTIDAVVFNENSYDAARLPDITAEFAHVVYRFGHSMMTEEIGRAPVLGGDQSLTSVPLLSGFLNPLLFDDGGRLTVEEAAGAWVNGMTEVVGSQIDEHVVDVLRNNLLGLPLDLPTLNLLRGRDTGVPPLQEARRTFFEATGEASLAPYANWDDFGRNTKNGNNFGRGGERASLVNFVAAYGTHESVLDAVTLEEKRAAAALLVNGAPAGEEFVIRLAGPDRFQTARAIAERHFQPGVPVAYIAPGADFPDALAGGPLAAATGGPILLAGAGDTGEIPLATVLALSYLQPQQIVVLGGPGVVGPRTVASLNAISSTDAPVRRISGADRYATAQQIALELEPGGRVFIANGLTFPDALAGAAVAASDGSAVLLVQPNAIPDATRAALLALNPSEIVVLGGTGAVSAAVASQLSAYTAGAVTRVGGADRYETAELISQRFFPDGTPVLYVATGANFPDALTATPGAGMNNAPLLLVPPTGLTPDLVDEIRRLAPQQIRILGGIGVVSEAVELALAEFAPAPLRAPEDRLEFMNGTGAWEGVETGLNRVDFWIGGLAERLSPFGGMLGSTFNFVFETQLEDLQFGDRFYYLFRNEGEQLFAALEGNTFSDMIQRNTLASHLPADIFALQDPVIDIAAQAALDPANREAGLRQLANGAWLWSGDEHVEMHGTPANDFLIGDEGDDAIWGYAGNDRIEGGAGNDALVGGPGDDIITDSFGDDNIKGMQGNDYIHSGPGIDLALGGLGDDFMVNGAGEGTVFFGGMGDDVILSPLGRFQAVVGGEHNDWIEGGPHADLLQGDNADQFQNDVLGGHDVVIGRLGNDDIEGEGGDDILVGEAVGTDRHHGGLGWDWLTYYGQTGPVTSDWAFNRFFEPNNPIPSRFDHLEALSGGAGNDILRGPIAETDDLAGGEIPLTRATEASLARIDGLNEMLRPVLNGVALGDFALPFLRGAPEADSDGVHMIIIGGPGSDTIEGRGGNDFLHGDAMLVVQLEAPVPTPEGVVLQRFDSSVQLMPLVASGAVNPGDIEIVREIVYDTDPASIDTAEYNNPMAAYAITPLGPVGSGYWRVEHTQVQEAEESDGVDILVGFERLQFADGCAQLAADGLSWEACLPTAEISMVPTEPIEGAPVTAQLWLPGEVGVTPFDTAAVTNLRYTWRAGEGDAPDAITEWEDVLNPLGSGSATFVPTQGEVGQYLLVTASYTDAGGFFRTTTAAVSTQPIADVPGEGALPALVHTVPLIPGASIPAGVPTDPDGGIAEDSLLSYQWAWTTTDPTGAEEPVWTDYAIPDGLTAETWPIYAPTVEDIGRWIRVSVTYTDGGGTVATVSAFTLIPVTAAG